MAEFVNAKTPNPEEENDTELNLEALDGVSGGARIYPNLGIMEAGEGSPGLQTTDTTQPGTETTPAGGGFSVQRYRIQVNKIFHISEKTMRRGEPARRFL